MINRLNHNNLIPILRTLVWLIGLLCATFGLVMPVDNSSSQLSILIPIISGYGIILFESFVSFVDIAIREDDRVFKASVFAIIAVVVFHFSTTFPFTYMLYRYRDMNDILFTVLIFGLIVYISIYKWFVEYVDKNIDLWTAVYKVRTVSSKI